MEHLFSQLSIEAAQKSGSLAFYFDNNYHG
jgi:hypothetical protein